MVAVAPSRLGHCGGCSCSSLQSLPLLCPGLCCSCKTVWCVTAADDGSHGGLQMAEELLVALIATGVLSVPVFFMVGLHGSFVVFWMVYFLTLAGSKSLLCSGFGYIY
jgi:hypothetical protein